MPTIKELMDKLNIGHYHSTYQATCSFMRFLEAIGAATVSVEVQDLDRRGNGRPFNNYTINDNAERLVSEMFGIMRNDTNKQATDIGTWQDLSLEDRMWVLNKFYQVTKASAPYQRYWLRKDGKLNRGMWRPLGPNDGPQ